MQETGERWRLGHRPALDGLRGVAIALVLVCHLGVPGVYAAGPLGVTIFFTLSGFLITSLLLAELGRAGRINLRGFYARRARRLLPALLACVACCLLVAPVIGSGFATVPGAFVTVFYGSNWVAASGLELGAFAHTWSLSVEEQFYLLWPVVLLVASRWGRRGIGAAAVAGAVASMVERLLLWDGGAGRPRVYFGADTHADALLLGCLLAVAMTSRREGKARPVLVGAALACAAPLAFTSGYGCWMALPTLAPLLACAAILGAARGCGVGWLACRPLAWLGRRSYGLYLWHVPVVFAVTILLPGVPWFLSATIVLPVSLALAVASWRFVEQPFMRSKGRTTGSRRPADSTPAVTATAATLAA